MASKMVPVAGLARRRVVRFHGNDKRRDVYRVVRSARHGSPQTVLQSKVSGKLLSVPNSLLMFPAYA